MHKTKELKYCGRIPLTTSVLLSNQKHLYLYRSVSQSTQSIKIKTFKIPHVQSNSFNNISLSILFTRRCVQKIFTRWYSHCCTMALDFFQPINTWVKRGAKSGVHQEKVKLKTRQRHATTRNRILFWKAVFNNLEYRLPFSANRAFFSFNSQGQTASS